jgi:hypothetical protein
MHRDRPSYVVVDAAPPLHPSFQISLFNGTVLYVVVDTQSTWNPAAGPAGTGAEPVPILKRATICTVKMFI